MPHTVVLSLPKPTSGQETAAAGRMISPHRISLEPQSPATDALHASLRTHPETRKYLPFFPERFGVDDARKLRESWDEDKTRIVFDIFVSEPTGGTKVFAGSIGILRTDFANEYCHIGLMIVPEFFGQGIATVAMYLTMECIFEQTVFGSNGQVKGPLHRVTFETGEDNIPMRSWLEKCAGIPLEGTIRDAFKEENRPVFRNMLTYGLLAHEWRDTVKSKLAEKIGIA